MQMYQEIKARKPGWRIGWYTDPVRGIMGLDCRSELEYLQNLASGKY